MIDVLESFKQLKDHEKRFIDCLGYDLFDKANTSCKIYIPEQVIEETTKGLNWYLPNFVFLSELVKPGIEDKSYHLSLVGLGGPNINESKFFRFRALDDTDKELGINEWGSIRNFEYIFSGGSTSKLICTLQQIKVSDALEWKVEAFIEFLS